MLQQCDDLQATCKYKDATDVVLPAQAVAFERQLGDDRVCRTFSSGTIRWSWTLDDRQFDGDIRRPRPTDALKQITANILAWTGCCQPRLSAGWSSTRRCGRRPQRSSRNVSRKEGRHSPNLPVALRNCAMGTTAAG